MYDRKYIADGSLGSGRQVGIFHEVSLATLSEDPSFYLDYFYQRPLDIYDMLEAV